MRINLLLSVIFINFSSFIYSAQAVTVSSIVSACGATTLYNTDCRHTPDKYQVTIYEMGLCTVNPMSTGTFNTAACTKTFENTTGDVQDIASQIGNKVKLDGTSTRPADGTYGFPYIKLSNVFTVKSSYTVGGTKYYSKSDNDATTNSALWSDFNETLTTFAAGCDPEYLGATVDVGTISAYLVQNTTPPVNATAGGGSCGNAVFLMGVIALDTPLEIDSTTIQLSFNFNVTNYGSQITGDTGDIPDEFGSGPFSGTFTQVKSTD